jgi:hypothetical protein
MPRTPKGIAKSGKAAGQSKGKKRPIEPYEHSDKKRVNNPPAGLVTPETDPPAPSRKTYEHYPPVPSVRPGKELDYDPHLDPQLVWAGKKEHTSFDVPTVSLHVHERIDPRSIIEAVRKRRSASRLTSHNSREPRVTSSRHLPTARDTLGSAATPGRAPARTVSH